MRGSLVPVATAMSGGTPEPVGWFRYDVADDSWTWSPGLFEIHGFQPGEIVPTSAVFNSHKHPDDRAHTNEVMVEAIATGQPFCCRHRIIDNQNTVRTVVSIGRGSLNSAGQVTVVHGYLVDITDTQGHASGLEMQLAVESSAATRADIEQAKGALMIVHGLSAEDAFAVLRWHSSHANLKLRDVARILTAGMSEPATPKETPEQRISRLLGGLVDGYTNGWRNVLPAPTPAAG